MDIIKDKENYKEECQTCGPLILGCFFNLCSCISKTYMFLTCQT